MMLSKKEKVALIIFIIFVAVCELYHVAIDTNPPTVLRMGYIAVYLFYAVLYPNLIPTFTAVNLIVERFSCSFGEFLPNTLIFHIAVLLYCGLVTKETSLFRSVNNSNKSCLPFFVILYVYAIFSLFLHVNISYDFSFVINGSFLIAYLYCLSKLNDKHIKSILTYSIIAMAIVCFVGLLNYDRLVSDYQTSLGSVERIEWKDANYFSFCIAIYILFSTFFITHTNSKKYLWSLYIACLLMATCMVMLISRGSIIALCIALLYYFRQRLLSLKSVAVLTVIAGIVLLFYYVGLLDGLIMRFMSEDLSSGSGRTEIWETGIKTFFAKDNWTILFGAGEGQASKMVFLDGKYWSPHNNYLEMLYNYGIIGLILFIVWLIAAFRLSKSREARSVLLLIMINSFTIVPFTFVTPIWFIMALLLVWDRRLINNMLYETPKPVYN